MADGPDFRMILAARDHDNLSQVAKDNGMQCRCFGLDHPDEVLRQLEDLEVDVVINAAGPFAWTAERLARAALAARCHYVDINGEVDVYKRLDDLGLAAQQQDVALVSGAAATPATSDILLSAALQQITEPVGARHHPDRRGARHGVSRGSALSAARQLREQVVTVRRGVRREAGAWRPADVLWHQPIGRLERTFDFGDRDRGERRLAIASAANLIDTLVALCTVRRWKRTVRAIESYVETGTVGRIGYQVGGMLAMFSAFPVVRGAANASLGLLPAGPDEEERMATRHVVLLEIDDPFRQRLVDWRLETPNVYQWTAQVAVAVAMRCTACGPERVGNAVGGARLHREGPQGGGRKGRALRGCHLQTSRRKTHGQLLARHLRAEPRAR